MTDDPRPTLAPCRVITSRHDPMFPVSGEVLWSYTLCQQQATVRRVTDGKREEMLPICDDHWGRLWDEGGSPDFSIDSVLHGEPVIEPRWLG